MKRLKGEARACRSRSPHDSGYRWLGAPPGAGAGSVSISVERNVASFLVGPTLSRYHRSRDAYELRFPSRRRVVFVVTPPELHCRIAAQWLTRADTIVVEKPPFDTDALTAVERMVHQLGATHRAQTSSRSITIWFAQNRCGHCGKPAG